VAGAIVVGVGPGIGLSVARRFAREGLKPAVIARSQATVDAATAALNDEGFSAVGLTADVTDESALRSALDQAMEAVGSADVLVYNAALIQWDALGELSAAGHLQAWAVNVVGAITATTHVAPYMVRAGHGTMLLTGGMPVPVPEVASLSLGKAGIRTLTDLLDARFRADGIHVATVTVGGAVSPGSAYDPDEIAEHYWRLHAQHPKDAWEREVEH
jgi:NAD(P)-dependent dehydrogenase (short-subunit alcohol dehydrogenase family)